MKGFWWIAAILAAALLAVFLLQPGQAVLKAGDITLDNTQFAYFYWSEFFYFKEAYGSYLADSVDFSRPLSQQLYAEGVTWEDYLINECLNVAADTLAMVLGAQKAGFVLPEVYEEALKDTWNNFLTQSGGDMDAYLQESYGKKANAESFYTYLEYSHLASAYADELYNSLNPSTGEIEAYLADHMGEYLDAGLSTAEQYTQAWEDLLAQQHGEQVRQIRAAADVRVNLKAIRIRAPKGLYE